MDKKLRIKELVDLLVEHNNLYILGKPIISDKEWDDMYFELLALEQETGYVLVNSPTQRVACEVKSDLEKIKHSHPMLSLDKTKDIETLENFIGEKEVIISAKMDGLSCSLTYEKGYLKRAETRGNGEIGEDILHNALVIKNIPKKINTDLDVLTVDGEIICTYENFKPFSNNYQNPRNFAAGSIRLLSSIVAESRNLSFIAWSLITDEKYTSVSSSLNMLKNLSFNIVPFEIYSAKKDGKIEDFIEKVKQKAVALSYPIDGLVIRYNDLAYGRGLGTTNHHPGHSLAFKFYDEQETTKLIDVEWSMGRTGVLTPIAKFETVFLEGTDVSKASLHNYGIMKELGVNKVGQTLHVFKANQIIPQVAKAEDDGAGAAIDYPRACPVCGGETAIETSRDGVENIICKNPSCSGKLINRLVHFCGKTGLDIKGLSKATIEKLINLNWLTNEYDIFNLKNKRNEWVKIAGFGPASVDKILKAIEESRKTNFVKFIAAMGIPLIGVSVAKELNKRFKTYKEFREAIAANFDFCLLPTFGIEKDRAINSYNYKIMDKIAEEFLMFENDFVEQNNCNLTLKDKIFVITGKLSSFKNRAELKTEIEKRGGKVTDNVTAKTSYLINNDIESNTGKNKKAKELNIPVINETQIIALLEK